MKRLNWAWPACPAGCSLLVWPRPAGGAAPTTAVPTAQQQCFQVQFLLRLPGLEALRFIQAVKSLRDLDPDDEADDRPAHRRPERPGRRPCAGTRRRRSPSSPRS